ncbi:hypothetical protein [Kozakia baliensis]|uniref:hypothetical protein n=1 Tax=Kozakia baliensis TaxID=153496 RepID=UPI00126935E6|nr:hypothetical protein [Kozakia baliensis]
MVQQSLHFSRRFSVFVAHLAMIGEAALVANQSTIETHLITLYRALGGGWEHAEIPIEKIFKKKYL